VSVSVDQTQRLLEKKGPCMHEEPRCMLLSVYSSVHLLILSRRWTITRRRWRSQDEETARMRKQN